MSPELEKELERLSFDEHTQHDHHAHMNHQDQSKKTASEFKLAVNATLHCLLGCFIGEIIGLLIAAALGLNTMDSMMLALAMGFVAGLSLGILPLLKAGFAFWAAFKTIFVAEGLSIAVMEGFEIFVQLQIPGAMEAGLTDSLFWLSMAGGLAVGFIAALPVNYVLIKRGIRHQH
ncbi:MAG: DUF4396 domain-containing protein [Ignavibacteriae bacterium]|nr:DUF4396 domain-containing protein [Ignavibacteriota bacterium]MCI0707928.1 DUF4396 domain-containing protein [Ignavibacteriota bacterium]